MTMNALAHGKRLPSHDYSRRGSKTPLCRLELGQRDLSVDCGASTEAGNAIAYHHTTKVDRRFAFCNERFVSVIYC